MISGEVPHMRTHGGEWSAVRSRTHGGEIWKRSSIFAVTRTVHSNPSPQRSFSKTFFTINASINSSGAHPHPHPHPRATTGHLLTLSVPGVPWWGIGKFYRGPGAGHHHTPGRPPDIWHTSFRKMDEFIGKDGAFVKDWQGLEKPVNDFKGTFSQFKIFFHYL